jgi:hypothetical protein
MARDGERAEGAAEIAATGRRVIEAARLLPCRARIARCALRGDWPVADEARHGGEARAELKRDQGGGVTVSANGPLWPPLKPSMTIVYVTPAVTVGVIVERVEHVSSSQSSTGA